MYPYLKPSDVSAALINICRYSLYIFCFSECLLLFFQFWTKHGSATTQAVADSKIATFNQIFLSAVLSAVFCFSFLYLRLYWHRKKWFPKLDSKFMSWSTEVREVMLKKYQIHKTYTKAYLKKYPPDCIPNNSMVPIYPHQFPALSTAWQFSIEFLFDRDWTCSVYTSGYSTTSFTFL